MDKLEQAKKLLREFWQLRWHSDPSSIWYCDRIKKGYSLKPKFTLTEHQICQLRVLANKAVAIPYTYGPGRMFTSNAIRFHFYM